MQNFLIKIVYLKVFKRKTERKSEVKNKTSKYVYEKIIFRTEILLF